MRSQMAFQSNEQDAKWQGTRPAGFIKDGTFQVGQPLQGFEIEGMEIQKKEEEEEMQLLSQTEGNRKTAKITSISALAFQTEANA